MKFLSSLNLTKKTLIILFLILALHLFTRLYNQELVLGFGHDEDLGAWIAKDIVVDHNLRLIGQETSVNGVFIGPIFYYLQAFYFATFRMDPIGGLYLTLTISILCLLSIFYTFRKFFGEKTAFISALIYASSAALAGHDTWIVPTQPTLLWTTWFLFGLFYIVEENNPKIFILLGVLLGLIWHVHIAFIPLIALVPLALFLSKKRKPVKELLLSKHTLVGAGIFIILMLPFFAFETRHNFTQINGLLNSLSEDRNASEGRLFKVYDGATWSFMNILNEERTTDNSNIRIVQAAMALIFIMMLFLNHKILGKKAWIIYGWLFITIFSQLISKRSISEYYFTNLTIPEVLTIGLFLGNLKKDKFSQVLLVGALGIFVFLNLKNVTARTLNTEGYLARKNLISFIAKDAKSHNYPCIAINYITLPGKNAGFRYFFWWNDLKLITPGNDVAVYSILNPATDSDEIAKKEGSLGVILPNNPIIDPSACDKPDRQLLPLWGFNN